VADVAAAPTPGAAAVAGAVAAPASDAAVSSVPKQGRGPYKKTQAPPTQAERDGLQEMVDAIGAAFQRAKARGKEDKVYHYMDLPSNRR
ncbi:unnamed protein product, partial [Ectocarpus sp. 12 AP-2014]